MECATPTIHTRPDTTRRHHTRRTAGRPTNAAVQVDVGVCVCARVRTSVRCCFGSMGVRAHTYSHTHTRPTPLVHAGERFFPSSFFCFAVFCFVLAFIWTVRKNQMGTFDTNTYAFVGTHARASQNTSCTLREPGLINIFSFYIGEARTGTGIM